MNLFTKIDIPAANWQIDFTKKIVFWGSCFAENISARFTEHKFNVLANPFGTVYNPLSIEQQLQHVANGKIFAENDVFQDIRRDNGHGDNLWHCWDAHSSLSAPTREECIVKLNRASTQAREFLQQADVVFITIGSAFVYSLDGNVVANCHRQDPKIFERKLISVEEAAQAIRGIIECLCKITADQGNNLHIVFTVSPIRHKGDGAHGNNLSKATLLLAINKVLTEIASTHCSWRALPSTQFDASYFPSYEIVMDELRDYRFYESDMIHLSKISEQIIFERMIETYCSESTREDIAKVEKFLKLASHRIQDEHSPASQELRQKILLQATELQKQIPGLQFPGFNS